MDGSVMVYARPVVVRCVGVVVSLIRLPQVTDRCLDFVIKNDGTKLNFTQVSRPSPPSSRTIPYPPGRGQVEDAHGLAMQPSSVAVYLGSPIWWVRGLLRSKVDGFEPQTQNRQLE